MLCTTNSLSLAGVSMLMTSQYGSYHHNQVNIAIHMICVPMILVTSFIFAANSPVLIPLPSHFTVPNLPLDLGTLATIGYCAFYILLEPIAGGLISLALLASTAYGHHLLSIAPSLTNQIAICVFIISWIAQFTGHGAFEGRAPALLDNLVQALVLAPFFVWMEVLFMLGYRTDLKARVDKEVEKEIEKFKKSKGKEEAKSGATK